MYLLSGYFIIKALPEFKNEDFPIYFTSGGSDHL